MSYPLAKISSSKIPTVYPYTDYIDNIYIDEDYNRIVFIDYITDVFNTDKKYKTTTGDLSDNYIQRKVQSIVSKKYELSIITKENNGLSLLNASDIIDVYLEDGTIHKAKLIETVESEFVDETMQFREFKIVYIDISTQKYPSYLRSDVLIDEMDINTDDLWEVKISSNNLFYEEYIRIDKVSYISFQWNITMKRQGQNQELNVSDPVNVITSDARNNIIHKSGTVVGTTSTTVTIGMSGAYFDYINSNIRITWTEETPYEYLFYTKLKPLFQETEKEEEINSVNGLEKIRGSISQKVGLFQCYFNEDDKNIIKKIARIWELELSFKNGDEYYKSLEGVIPEIREDSDMIDCYSVTLPVKFENTVYDPY